MARGGNRILLLKNDKICFADWFSRVIMPEIEKDPT